MTSLCDSHDLGTCSVEADRIREWLQDHAKTCAKVQPSKDMTMTAGHVIILRPTSIGPNISVQCDCGAKKAICHVEHL